MTSLRRFGLERLAKSFIVSFTKMRTSGGSILKFMGTMALLMLATFVVVPSMLAADYSAAESVAENFLLDPQYGSGTITGADVSISPDEVVFDCNTDVSFQETGAPLEQVGTFIGTAIGVYYLVLQSNPEVGDLTIIMKNRNDPTTAVMTCAKSWVNNADLSNEANELISKVFLTTKKA